VNTPETRSPPGPRNFAPAACPSPSPIFPPSSTRKPATSLWTTHRNRVLLPRNVMGHVAALADHTRKGIHVRAGHPLRLRMVYLGQRRTALPQKGFGCEIGAQCITRGRCLAVLSGAPRLLDGRQVTFLALGHDGQAYQAAALVEQSTAIEP